MHPIRQNSTDKIRVGPVIDSSGAIVTTLTLTSADTAVAILDDDSVEDLAAFTFAAVTSADGMYDLTMTTAITDTPGRVDILIVDADRNLPVAKSFQVLEEEVFDAFYASGAAGFQAGPTLAVPSNTTKPPTNPTLEEALMYVYWRLIYGKVTVDATEEIVFADDGTTELYTKAVTDAGGTVTYAEAVAGV